MEYIFCFVLFIQFNDIVFGAQLKLVGLRVSGEDAIHF